VKTFLAVVFLTSDPQTLLIRPLTLSPEMVSWDVDLKIPSSYTYSNGARFSGGVAQVKPYQH